MSSNRDSSLKNFNNGTKDSPKQRPKISAEDKPTDHWIPSSAAPFQNASGPNKDFDEHLKEMGKPTRPMDDLPLDENPIPKVLVSPEAFRVVQQSPAKGAARKNPQVDPEELDTVEMTPEEAAVMLAEVKTRAEAMDRETLKAKNNSQTKIEGAAGNHPTIQPRSATGTPSLECRMCGRKVNASKPVHFRGPASSHRGFRCEKCGNVLCASHAIRISGFFASLLGHARFSCPLCLPSGKTV